MMEDNPKFDQALRSLHDQILQTMAPRVLIVDDSEDDVLVVRHALREVYPRIHTQTRSTKEEVVALVSSEQFDLVLLDLRLGLGLTGVEVLKAIREISKVPVAGLTGSDDKTALWHEAMNEGLDVIFQKPLSKNKIRLLFGMRAYDSN